MTLPIQNVLYLAPESTYNVNPSAAGSGFLYVPATQLSLLADDREILETNYFVGRGYRTAHEPGASAWSLSCSVPLHCLESMAGTGVNASTIADDVLDMLLNHILGTRSTTAGVGLASGTGGAGVLVADSSGFALQQAILVGYASASRGSVHQVTVASAAPSYTIRPYLPETIDTNWESAGGKHWQPTLGLTSSLAAFYRRGSQWYACTGGKVTAAKISATRNQAYSLDLTIRGVTIARSSAPGSIPAAVPPTRNRLVHTRAAIAIGTTVIDNDGFEFDFGLTAEQVPASHVADGVSADETVAINPTLTVRPMWSTALEDLKSAGTVSQVAMSLGSGVYALGRANAMGLVLPGMQVENANTTDQRGREHHDLRLVLADTIAPAADAAASARIFTLSRF